MGKSKWLVAALLALAGCKQTREVREHREQVQAAAPSATMPITPAALPDAPSTVEASAAYAVFRGDSLDECTDIAISAPASAGEAKAKTAVEGMRKAVAPKGAATVTSSCAEQFKDRYVLGSCRHEEVTALDGGVLVALILSSYYDVRTTKDSDAHMRACLKDNGKWTAAAKDDREAARERLRQRARDAMKSAEEAQRAINGM